MVVLVAASWASTGYPLPILPTCTVGKKESSPIYFADHSRKTRVFHESNLPAKASGTESAGGEKLPAYGGLHENPDDVTFLLLTEVRSLNARLAYVLGALSIIVALFLAHVLAGL